MRGCFIKKKIATIYNRISNVTTYKACDMLSNNGEIETNKFTKLNNYYNFVM